MDWKAIAPLLEAKLDPRHVKKGGGNFGPKGDYLEGWFVIQEANRIFGHGGWSYSLHLTKDDLREIEKGGKKQWQAAYTCVCTLTVGFGMEAVCREDVGFGSGFSANIGDAIEGATKEAATDSLKRCLRTFGNPFGLALYDKSRENVGAPEPEPRKEPGRDPAKVADALVAKVEGAKDKGALDKVLGLSRFDEAWDWLAIEAPHQSERVRSAVEAARARLDPLILGENSLEPDMPGAFA